MKKVDACSLIPNFASEIFKDKNYCKILILGKADFYS